MVNLLRNVLLFSLSVIVTLSVAFCQDTKSIKIDSFIRRANQLGLFNGNILVADHDKVVYKAALGFTDASGQTRLTEQYRFNIGSIAKEFSAIGIMMLKEQGKLSLDDKISKYVTYLPLWANKVSIKNLLQYTSGVPDVKWRSVKNDAGNREDLKKIDKPDFEPGSNYAYNNNDVFLRREIIEKVTGLSFKAFVEQKMLKPCEMTMAVVDPTDTDQLVAKSYNDDHKQDPLTYPVSGWTNVTLEDFYKWEKSIESFRLISPESTKEIITPVAPGKQCGLGAGSMEGSQLLTHIHDGTALNYQALLVSNIPQKRTVILLTNNKQGNLYELNTAIQKILDGKPYQMPVKSLLKVNQNRLDTMDGVQILAFYEELKKNNPTDYGFDNESTLNEIGYFLLGKNKLTDAIVVFEYNTKLFPASGNVYDSLGEAYFKQGDKQKALLNYKLSYKLDPTNISAKDIIAQLER
jgi:CubicO group peptidase (beta-lactamase class C family)